MESKACCNAMREQIFHKCDFPGHEHYCPDQLIQRYQRDGKPEYGLAISPDAGGGFYRISYCPFCGDKL